MPVTARHNVLRIQPDRETVGEVYQMKREYIYKVYEKIENTGKGTGQGGRGGGGGGGGGGDELRIE